MFSHTDYRCYPFETSTTRSAGSDASHGNLAKRVLSYLFRYRCPVDDSGEMPVGFVRGGQGEAALEDVTA